MVINHFSFNLFHENTILLWNEGAEDCIVIDPGFSNCNEKKEFYDYLQKEKLKPVAILLTHGHIDHIFGVKHLQDKFKIPVFLHPEDKETMKIFDKQLGLLKAFAPNINFITTDVADGQIIPIGKFTIKVIHTPGHSPGSVCYLVQDEELGFLFSGDTLFNMSIGRTDLAGGNYDDEIRSIMEKIIWLDPDLILVPGHGSTSTIGEQRNKNPFLEPWGEKEEIECEENSCS